MARKDRDGGEGLITPKKARNAVAVAKIIVPVVAPVVAPFAVQALAKARDAYDRYQARKLGVAVDELGEYTGRGARLHARIAGIATGLGDLDASERATADDHGFAADSQATLNQLAAAVRAAERMPSARRKAAHRAVGDELDRIETGLLDRLGAG